MSSKNQISKASNGWMPLVKVRSANNYKVNALWSLFIVCMITALVSSIYVVVHKYLSYVTVVRLDQRGPKDGVPPPAVTVCLMEQPVVNTNRFRSNPSDQITNLISNEHNTTNITCDDKFNIIWESRRDGKSSSVREKTKNFEITLRTAPPDCYSLSVIEHIPNPYGFLCNTFKLNFLLVKKIAFWKIFHIDVRLSDRNQSLTRPPLLIAHEPNSYPFDNYGRYLYEYIKPGSSLNLFYSKMITKRLNTRRNPCNDDVVNLLGYEFDYDQITCQWYKVCELYHECNCTCPLESSSNTRTFNLPGRKKTSLKTEADCSVICNSAFPTTLLSGATCPKSCRTVTYKKLNEVHDHLQDKGSVQLELIQAEGLIEMTEEALYSLAKLFSEIGGLSSFCFGFSCILVFEILELNVWFKLKSFHESIRRTMLINECAAANLKTGKTESEKPNKSSQEIGNNNNKGKVRKLIDLVFSPKIKYFPTHKQVEMNPIKFCQVDGDRLSEYSQNKDSPLCSLKRECEGLVSNQTSYAFQVQLMIERLDLLVPIQTDFLF